MPLAIEINCSADTFEQTLKWYSMLFKDKHPTKKDEETFHKISILVASIKEDDEDEKDE